MADSPNRTRFSPFGIALFAVLLLGLLFWAFIMSQRGGAANGEVGADGIEQPEQLETEDVTP